MKGSSDAWTTFGPWSSRYRGARRSANGTRLHRACARRVCCAVRQNAAADPRARPRSIHARPRCGRMLRRDRSCDHAKNLERGRAVGRARPRRAGWVGKTIGWGALDVGNEARSGGGVRYLRDRCLCRYAGDYAFHRRAVAASPNRSSSPPRCPRRYSRQIAAPQA